MKCHLFGGTPHHCNNNNMSVLEFPKHESVHIEEVTKMEAEEEEERKRCMRSEVWGTNPVRWSEQLMATVKKC